MKKTFIINGSGGAGKDTFVDFIKESYPKLINISAVAEINIIAKLYFGWDGEKTNKWRRVLSDLKFIQSEACNGPFNFMKEKWEEASDDDVLFFHIREPAEIDKFKELTGATTLLIRRMEEPEVYGNVADDGVLSYKYDIIIFNDTLSKLKTMAQNFCDVMLRR